jgi:hypothetical protein
LQAIKFFLEVDMFAEFDKVVRCLALELPSSVWDDVNSKYSKLKLAVKNFTASNSTKVSIENCTNCKYGGIQICRRNPPNKEGKFIFILEDWRTWCGEYRAAEKQGAEPVQRTTTAWCSLRKWLRSHFTMRQTLVAITPPTIKS